MDPVHVLRTCVNMHECGPCVVLLICTKLKINVHGICCMHLVKGGGETSVLNSESKSV